MSSFVMLLAGAGAVGFLLLVASYFWGKKLWTTQGETKAKPAWLDVLQAISSVFSAVFVVVLGILAYQFQGAIAKLTHPRSELVIEMPSSLRAEFARGRRTITARKKIKIVYYCFTKDIAIRKVEAGNAEGMPEGIVAKSISFDISEKRSKYKMTMNCEGTGNKRVIEGRLSVSLTVASKFMPIATKPVTVAQIPIHFDWMETSTGRRRTTVKKVNVFLYPGSLTKFDIGTDYVKVLGWTGKALWTKEVPKPISAYLRTVDEKGIPTGAIIGFGMSSSRAGEILALGLDGREMWRFRFGKDSPWKAPADIKYHVMNIRSVSHHGETIVVANAQGRPWFPNQIVALSGKGKVIGTYWHCGGVYNMRAVDIDSDGTVEIIAGGLANCMRTADRVYGTVVFLLDAEKMSGHSPSPKSKKAGGTRWYLVLRPLPGRPAGIRKLSIIRKLEGKAALRVLLVDGRILHLNSEGRIIKKSTDDDLKTALVQQKKRGKDTLRKALDKPWIERRWTK